MQVRSIILVCLLTLVSFFPALADETKIIKELKEGGKLILIRHSDAPGTGDPANFNINKNSAPSHKSPYLRSFNA